MRVAMLGDEGGKNAQRGGTLDLRLQFRNGGSRVLAGTRRLVVFLEGGDA